MGIGSVMLAILAMAFVYKIGYILTVVICPICVVNTKKSMRGKPRDFSHYENEFDFEIDYNDEPEV